MNLFQLILKQIRQRALSTVLTVFSITLGVALAIAIMVLQREGKNLFGQTEFGYEVIVGVKGSGLQLVANTVYRVDRSPGNIPYAVYERLLKDPIFRRDVKYAIPQCVGDSYEGLPIVGTTPQFFGYDDQGNRLPEGKRFEYQPGKSFEVVAPGKIFHVDKFEAVIGADVPRLVGLKVGDQFQATHGFPTSGAPADVHEEKWTVTGILAPTHTAADKCIYIGLTSFYTMQEHGEAEISRMKQRQRVAGEGTPAASPAPASAPAIDPHDIHDAHDDEDDHTGHHHTHHAHYDLEPDGRIVLHDEVKRAREVSAILVKTRGDGGFPTLNLIGNLNMIPDVMGTNPATVMREFFSNFLDAPITLLLAIAVLVTVIAAMGILTTIYNSVTARMREIAILRALGATRMRILIIISVEAALVGLLGGMIGFVVGHGLAGIGSAYMKQTFGQSIAWYQVAPVELWFIGGVVVLSFIAGLVPALKAYRTPVAVHLVAT